MVRVTVTIGPSPRIATSFMLAIARGSSTVARILLSSQRAFFASGTNNLHYDPPPC